MQSAQEELRCAQAIRSELLLLGQEALDELDPAPFSRQPGSQEITISDPQDFAPGILADAGRLGAAPLESVESPRIPQSGIPAEPGAASPTSSDAISGQASVAWESPLMAEPPATPEPEISDPETPSESPERHCWGWAAPLKLLSLRCPHRPPNRLQFLNYRMRSPRPLPLPNGSLQPRGTQNRAYHHSYRPKFSRPLLLPKGSLSRSPRRQLEFKRLNPRRLKLRRLKLR